MPGLLGKNVIRATKSGLKSGAGEKIGRTARVKMSEYYHDLLWHKVGAMAEKTILWSEIQGLVYLPFAMQHPRICLGLSNLLQDNLYAKFGGKDRRRISQPYRKDPSGYNCTNSDLFLE